MLRIAEVIGKIFREDQARKIKVGKPDEKAYLAVWEKIAPTAIRNHTSFSCRGRVIYLRVDNPVTGHRLNLEKKRLVKAYREQELPVDDIRIACR